MKRTKNRSRSAILIVAVAAGVLATSSCRRDGDSSVPADALVEIGRDVLCRSEISAAMPGGLSPDDSTKFAKAYISSWIDSHLVYDIAADEIDMAEINRLTEEYRRELVMSTYRRRMAENAVDGYFSEDSLRACFEANKGSFTLRRPMVRGVYIKVDNEAGDPAPIRKLYKSDRPEDIDRLEKAVHRKAVHYDYFRDRWVDWDKIETRVPYDFGQNPDAFLRTHKSLEVSNDGFTYLLFISEYLPTGAPMPFEAAEPLVRERMLAAKRKQYDLQLRQSILDKAESEGLIRYHYSR